MAIADHPKFSELTKAFDDMVAARDTFMKVSHRPVSDPTVKANWFLMRQAEEIYEKISAEVHEDVFAKLEHPTDPERTYQQGHVE
ncbi:MAG: hypothetical protein JWL86_1981 [Rhizobium sp.]|nr:hypothetical protein [Rhizobium sp.]